MKKRTIRRSLAMITALPLSAALTQAQTSPAVTTPAADDASDADVVVLDPFTVTTEQEGYQAVDTLAGGRVRTSLKDTPSSLSVITKKLMDDLAVTDAQSLLIYTNNTEVAGLGGNFSGVTSRGSGTTGELQRLASPTTANRSRGLAPMDNTRNYFPTEIPWDGFNISRVDITRGPNSFLFGFGSPSGISNVSTNDAIFTDKGRIEARYGSFGSNRQSLDYNKVLIPSELAIRINLVNDKTLYMQKPAFNHSQRAYGAVRIDPQMLHTDSAHTKIAVTAEHGEVRSNNPRMLPPTDYVTGYLNDPRGSTTGYNPWTYRQNGDGFTPQYSYYSSHGSLANQFQWSNALNYFWDAATGRLQKAGQAGWTSPTPVTGGNSAGYGASSFGLSNQYFVHSVGYAAAAQATNYAARLAMGDPVAVRDTADTPFKGAYFGTAAYFDQTLSDTSIFDFYHKLLDGDNKREWQNWNAYNASITQTLFNERLSIQGIFDHQEYRSGQENRLDNTVIALDLSSYLLAAGYPTWTGLAQANPNVGRPALYGGTGTGYKTETKRDNLQGTVVYNLNIERDLGVKSALGRILGFHDITGLLGTYENEQYKTDYKLGGVDHAWNVDHNGSERQKLADNGYTWTAYLGPSLLGTTGADANLPNLAYSIAPVMTNVTGYTSVWTRGTTVDPTAPWVVTGPTYLMPDGTTYVGGTLTLTQADNPANYSGYTTTVPGLLNPKANMDQLRTGASRVSQKVTSKAVMYQGHFWDDTIVASYGWRSDKTVLRGDVSIEDATTKLFPDVPTITDPGITTKTNSSSYGIALHLPKSIKKHLPEGTDVSLYYFHGDNETPKVRYAIDGTQLPNEKGKTDDYSIQFDGLDGRATLRLTYFKTVDRYAPASYGQPLGNGSGWMISALPKWTVTMAAAGVAAAEIGPENMGDMGQPWNNWFWQWGVDNPEVAAQVGQVLRTDFVDAFPQTYWDSYGINVDVAAIRAGDWMHVLRGTDQPWTWNTTGTSTIHAQHAIIDQDVQAKGFELEATIRPLKNWSITFNGSRSEAEQIKLGESAGNYLNKMATLWLESPLGMTAYWGGYTGFGSSRREFIKNLWGPYMTQVALTGTPQPEWAKWKFNCITNYSFDRGFLKGLNVGGAYRWEGRRIIGYGLHEAELLGTTSWISDVSQPLYSGAEAHVDLWVGYQRKVAHNLDWRIQLNVQNVGESVHLVTIVKQPDGSVAQSRIANGQQFSITSSLSF